MSLLPVEEALKRITKQIEPTGAESVGLSEAFGRVLARPVAARRTQPPRDLSAMDGYAVRAEDVASVPVSLRVVGESPAGAPNAGTLGPGEAVRIFTGGAVPDGADTIVIQEDTVREGDEVRIAEATAPGRHIRKRGLDFKEGDEGLAPGTLLTASSLALAAAMDVPWLDVHRKPVVAILSTGDELVRPGEGGGADRIVSANGVGVAALVREAGGRPVDLGIAPDDKDAIAEAALGAKRADILVTIGGASVGEHDLIQPALEPHGLEIDFWRIAMRPGKPLIFGRFGEALMLGLPGNPVSALVCGLQFLQPAIRAMSGLEDIEPATVEAVLDMPLGENDRRQDYLRARLVHEAGQWRASAFEVQDSSMLSLLAEAGGLIVRPPHAPPAQAGDTVPVIPLRP